MSNATGLREPLVILGAGGQGKVVADAAALAGETVEFVDDGWPALRQCSRWPIVGPADLSTLRQTRTRLHIAIGNGTVRERVSQQARDAGFTLVTVCHPTAIVSPGATLGDGCYLGPGAIVNVDSTLGDGVIVNTAASIDHDCVIGAYAHVAPGAHLAGGITVGTRAWIGIGAAVRNGITIGADVMVGAGAVVVKNVEAGLTVVGSPARPLARGSAATASR